MDYYQEALDRLNDIYAEMKYEQTGRKPEDVYFSAPEMRPQIQSTQVKALLKFIVEYARKPTPPPNKV